MKKNREKEDYWEEKKTKSTGARIVVAAAKKKKKKKKRVARRRRRTRKKAANERDLPPFARLFLWGNSYLKKVAFFQISHARHIQIRIKRETHTRIMTSQPPLLRRNPSSVNCADIVIVDDEEEENVASSKSSLLPPSSFQKSILERLPRDLALHVFGKLLIDSNDFESFSNVSSTNKYAFELSKDETMWSSALNKKWGRSAFRSEYSLEKGLLMGENYLRRLYVTREFALCEKKGAKLHVLHRLQILLNAFSQCANNDLVTSVSRNLLKRALTLALDVLRAADETSVELTSVTAVQNGTEEIEEMFAERVMAARVVSVVLTRFKKARRMVEEVFQFNNCAVAGGAWMGSQDEDDSEQALDADEEERASLTSSATTNEFDDEQEEATAFRILVARYLSEHFAQSSIISNVTTANANAHHSHHHLHQHRKQTTSISYIPAIPKRYLKKTFDKTCPSEWLFDCLTKNNNITLAVCQALYLEPLSAIEDYERKKEKFRYFPRQPSGGRFPLGSRPPASRHRRELLALKEGNRSDVSLMSGAWTGVRRSNYNSNSNSNNSSDRRVPFKGTLEFTKAGKISGFFVDAVGTTVVRGWVDPNSLSFALDARYTEVGGLPPMSLFRNEENKEIETRAAMELNTLRTSESSSGFEELAEQLEDEMGCGLYCRYRGVFNSISAGGVFCSNTSATSRSGAFSLWSE
jgi:hypothetical protein